MKSEGVVLENKRTYQIEAKSESEIEEKMLGLFDDDSYREERNLRRIGSSAVVVSFSFHQLSLSCFIVFLFYL
jgi:hypothetical protein